MPEHRRCKINYLIFIASGVVTEEYRDYGRQLSLNFSLSEFFHLVEKFSQKSIDMNGIVIFAPKVRKPGWIEQSKVVSQCILNCNFFMQTDVGRPVYGFWIIFLRVHQYETSK